MQLPPPDPLLREARSLMKNLEPDPAHVLQVAKISLRLFHLLAPIHRFGSREKQWLAASALLHDIGWSEAPDGRGHHKISARLIRQHPWTHLRAEEIDVVAQVARYHRRALPRVKHAAYARLGAQLRHRVCALAAILRVADALDRSHRSLVLDLDVEIAPRGIQLLAHTRDHARDEEFAFLKKRDLWVHHFEKSIHLHVRPRPR